MKLKRFSVVLTLVLAFGTLFSSLASAQTYEKPNLVALGDSITYGYNLPDRTQAFPYLIGNQGEYNVYNLGVPGMTSSQLLTAVLTNAQFKAALSSADVVTLDIGSNDLLQAAGINQIIANHTPVQLTPTLQANLLRAQQGLAFNLNLIIKAIKKQTNAPIILYNLYNPFGASSDPFLASLHAFGEQVITAVNTAVIKPTALVTRSLFADAYTAFNGHQATYIIPGDIHPNVEGHRVLAALADQALLKAHQKYQSNPIERYAN